MSLNSGAAPPREVCILRLSAIGDTCHVLAVVRALQRAWPQTRFTWIIGSLEASLLQDAAGIEFITLDKRAGRRARLQLRERLRDRNFDVLLHMHASMRANLASRSIAAPLRLGFDRARARDWQWLFTNRRIEANPRQHVLDGLFGFARSLGVHERELRWDIPLSAGDREFAAQVRGAAARMVVLSPCSSQRARNYRNWPADRYAAVVDHLHRRHRARVVVTGGPTELERRYAAEIAGRSEAAMDIRVGQTSLKQLFALICAADAVICPDSGPAHMGTAAATPVVGLYAGSNPGRTGPYLSRQWTVDKYPQAVRTVLGKSVDEVRWGRRVRDPAVMELIEVGDVTARLDELFASLQQPGDV